MLGEGGSSFSLWPVARIFKDHEARTEDKAYGLPTGKLRILKFDHLIG